MNIGEAKKALEIAKELLEQIKAHIETLNPQVKFEF